MNKTIQDLEVVIESKQKTQNEGSLQVKMEGLKTGVSEESPLNRRIRELTHAYRTFHLNTKEYTFPVLHGTFLLHTQMFGNFQEVEEN